jgi:hypothetical protein
MRETTKVPEHVVEEYLAYRNKKLTFSDMSRTAYHAMLSRFIKHGLHRPTGRKYATLSAELPRDEYLRRRRAYMKLWRVNHPNYNKKWKDRWKERKAQSAV